MQREEGLPPQGTAGSFFQRAFVSTAGCQELCQRLGTQSRTDLPQRARGVGLGPHGPTCKKADWKPRPP